MSRQQSLSRSGIRLRVGLLLLALGMTACENLLDVRLPGEFEAEGLDNPQLANTLITGLVGDFECAFVQYVGAGALLTDEMIHGTGKTDIAIWDIRNINAQTANHQFGECGGDRGFGTYIPLHRARFQAEEALRLLEGFDPAQVTDKAAKMATAAAYAGYTYVLFGEGYCRNAYDGGPAVDSPQSFQIAEQRFTRSIELAQQANNTDILNMARVGRARARLNLGKKAEAAADAQLVPPGYVKNATYDVGSNSRRWNKIARFNITQADISVDPDARNSPHQGVPDPRVRAVRTDRRGEIPAVENWIQQKYLNDGSPIPIATGKEAQLIVAEAVGSQTAVGIINGFHVQAGLPEFSSTDEQEILQHVLEERRRELFLEGHRFGDLIRHSLPFPPGPHQAGQPHGSTTCLPLPQVEIDQNPNIDS